MDDRDGAVGHRVPGVRHRLLGRVVLEEHRRDVHPGPQPGPLARSPRPPGAAAAPRPAGRRAAPPGRPRGHRRAPRTPAGTARRGRPPRAGTGGRAAGEQRVGVAAVDVGSRILTTRRAYGAGVRRLGALRRVEASRARPASRSAPAASSSGGRACRETCIWLVPSSAAMSLCERSSKKRIRSSSCSASVSCFQTERDEHVRLAALGVGVVALRGRASARPGSCSVRLAWPAGPAARPRPARRGRRRADARSARRRRPARPRASAATSRPTAPGSGRDGRMDQPWSRKCRLTRPVTVGKAKAAKGPWSGSKREQASTRPERAI